MIFPTQNKYYFSKYHIILMISVLLLLSILKLQEVDLKEIIIMNLNFFKLPTFI